MAVCALCGSSHTNALCPTCGTPAPLTSASAAVQQLGSQAVAVASASPAAGGSASIDVDDSDNRLSGFVTRVEGPRQMDPGFDGWRLGAVLLFILAVFPLWAAVWLTLFCLRTALRIMGLGSSGGHRSFLDELLFHHMLETMFRKREPVPFYNYVVETSSGIRMARQEGEFDTAQPVAGHRVTLEGKPRQGVLVIQRGVDETSGVSFARPVKRSMVWFFVALFVVAAEFAVLATLAS